MANVSVIFPSREISQAERVTQYLRRGWAPIPIGWGEKVPHIKDWPKYQVKDAEKEFLGKNIGVILGERSNHLVDVDLDCEAATLLAPYLLPPTRLVFGHGPGWKSRSHYIYRSVDVRHTAFDRARVELRAGPNKHSEAHQTIFPKSLHGGSGEYVEWADRFDPTVPVETVDAKELSAAVGRLAAGVLLIQGWTEGQRSVLDACIKGILVKAGWEPVEISDFLGIIAKVAGDEEWSSRADTDYRQARHKKGAPEYGIPTLVQLLGKENAEAALRWLSVRGEEEDVVSRMNEHLASLLMGGKHNVMLFEDKAFSLYPVNEVKKEFANKPVRIHGKLVNPIDIWMKSEHRRQYSSITFDPSRIYDPAEPVWNTWHGWACEPVEDEDSVWLWLWHTKHIIANRNLELYRYLLDYLAHLVQRPAERPQVALVLVGGEGTGKGLWVNLWGRILGPYYQQTGNAKLWLSEHNSLIEDRLMVFADEVVWGGDKQKEGALKNLITEPTIAIHHKYRAPYDKPNCIRLVIASNEAWVVPASREARRYCVCSVSSEKQGDKEYFRRLANIKPGAILKYLSKYPMTRTELFPPPMTRGLKEQKQLSLHSVHAWYLDRLREGSTLVGMVDWHQPVLVERLHQAYVHSHGYGTEPRYTSAEAFGTKLREVCPGLVRKQLRHKGYPKHHYILPSLEECRAEWEKWIRCKVNWDE